MTLTQPLVRKWTKAEYHAAAELGWFEGERVELMDGEVIQRAAQKEEHAISLTLTEEAARQAFGSGHTYRVQMPFDCGGVSEPEPDLVVLRGADHPQAPGERTAHRGSGGHHIVIRPQAQVAAVRESDNP